MGFTRAANGKSLSKWGNVLNNSNLLPIRNRVVHNLLYSLSSEIYLDDNHLNPPYGSV